MDKNAIIEAYSTIAAINGLRQVRDNVFVNDLGVEYYLDKYGFHTINQFNNSKVINLIDRAINYWNAIQQIAMAGEPVGKKTKKYLRNMLTLEKRSDAEKIQFIKEYLDHHVEQAEKVITKLQSITDLYKPKS